MLLLKKITTITVQNQEKQESQVQKLLVEKISINIQCYNVVSFVYRVRGTITEESGLLE